MMPVADMDIREILERKARGRKMLAQLSFGEKLRILEAMKKEAKVFRRLREARAANSAKAT